MRRMCIVAVTCVLLVLPLLAGAQDRGLQVTGALLDPDISPGRQWFVFVAIDKYGEWPGLSNPVKDAKELRKIIQSRYYVDEVRELYDEEATKAGILKLFTELMSAVKPEDLVFIYYAGHGQLDEISNTGFWIPQDAGADQGIQANWLPNAQVRGYIMNLKARHIALVSDACFSGDILNLSRGALPPITNDYFKKAYSRRSRQAMTSGASETVPDRSEFAMNLKETLSQNDKQYLDLLSVYNDIKTGVRITEPLMGDFKDSAYQKDGCFLFFLKKQGGTTSPQQPDASSGTLQVLVTKPGSVYVDGKLKGEVKDKGLLKVEGLEPRMCNVKVIYSDLSSDQKAVKVEKGETVLLEFGSTSLTPVPSATPATGAPTVVKVTLLPSLAQAQAAAAKERTESSRKVTIVVFASDNRERDEAAFAPYLADDAFAALLAKQSVCTFVSNADELSSLRDSYGVSQYPAIVVFNSHMSKVKDFYQLGAAETKEKLTRIVRMAWE